MSFPPYLPPVPGTPNGPAGYTPPFFPTTNPVFGGGSVTMSLPGGGPPTPAQVAAAESAAPPSPYSVGPFCFGLDEFICANLPPTITLGKTRVTAGVDIPVQDFCRALTNTLCAVLVLILLLTILGIAFFGLVT